MSGGGKEEPRAQSSGDDASFSEEKDCSSSNQGTSQGSESGDSSETDSDGDSESGSDGEQGDSAAEESSLSKVEELEKKELQPNCRESEFENSPPHCTHCRTENNQNEKVTPRQISRGQFLLKLNSEGTYQCTETGLIFEVKKKVDIKYCLLSWSKFSEYVKKPWIVGGPIFDVKCDPFTLNSIQFPHSLCLGYHESNMTFKVLHIKGSGAAIEPTVDHSTTHVKWNVSSLSPVGPVIQSADTVFHHGAVILYKVIDNHPSLSFRVYVATNNDSFIKDIAKTIKQSTKKFMKIDKPPVCLKLLENEKKYRLISEPEAEITPEEIQFVDGSLLKLKSYIEVFLEQPVDFKLSLVELDSGEIVWKAKLRECDWAQLDQNQNIQRNSTNSNRRRKMDSTLHEEISLSKKVKWTDVSDGVKREAILNDAQLMNLAKTIGKEWVEIAIANLALEMCDIDKIQEKKEEVTVCKFRMLKKWQEKEQKNATAQNLFNCLKDVATVEVHNVLKGFLQQI
ncbi:caspase recruitment domain-containing protein 8 isoform X1 [Tachyglossus aculeatus]|uniref:caspase recruitment domain-containing protein 8 isoform X1 n=1 Tax=Tachyglossus aculeatus TaxID=9261 RepID=UPI0018F6D5DF|nr:caspase recruitment domain-containing protein 8 isoform X1 [Tachyglossus aculeatus]